MAMKIGSTYSNYPGVGGGIVRKENITEEVGSKNTQRKSEVKEYDERKYLAELNRKNPKLNIMSGKVDTSYRGGQYPKKVDVMIAPNILAQMASSPEAADKYGKMLANIPMCERWANSMIKAMTGNEVKYRQVWIDENGNMGSFCISGPSEAQKEMDAKRKEDEQEAYEKRLERAKEKRMQFEEWVQGDGEELLHINILDTKKHMSIDIKV